MQPANQRARPSSRDHWCSGMCQVHSPRRRRLCDRGRALNGGRHRRVWQITERVLLSEQLPQQLERPPDATCVLVRVCACVCVCAAWVWREGDTRVCFGTGYKNCSLQLVTEAAPAFGCQQQQHMLQRPLTVDALFDHRPQHARERGREGGHDSTTCPAQLRPTHTGTHRRRPFRSPAAACATARARSQPHTRCAARSGARRARRVCSG